MDTRFYRALIVQDDGEGSDDGYGVVFPDLPGCTSLGETVEQAYEHAFEALALHIEGMVEEGIPLPQPSPFTAPLPDWLAAAGGGDRRADRAGAGQAAGPSREISITMDKGLLDRLDNLATAKGDTRSGYIAEAVRERVEQRATRRGPPQGQAHAGTSVTEAIMNDVMNVKGSPTAHTPGMPGADRLTALASRYVDVGTLPWKPTPCAGIEMKILVEDTATGLLTALFRWQPGAELTLS